MSNYKASIILPVYNKAHCLKTAMNSIVAQSRFQEFEVILVDDCSTDNSFQIAQSYADKHENISVVQLPEGSGSPSRPRNTGIDMSTADYVIFMDPDDKIINDGYSLLLSKMEEYQSDVLIGTRVGVGQNGKVEDTSFVDVRFRPVNENSDFYRKYLLSRPPFIKQTIYRKQLLQEHDIRFCEKIRTSEDVAFDMTCMAYAQRVTKIDDIVYQYTREAKGSITTVIDPSFYREMYDVLDTVAKALQLSFSETIISEHLARIVRTFYIQRTSYMTSAEEVHQACELIREALERYGFARFDCLLSPENIEFIDDMKRRNYEPYITRYMVARIRVLNKRLAQSDKQLKTARKKLKDANKKLDRRLVRSVLRMSDRLGSVRKRKPKAGPSPAKNKQGAADAADAQYKEMFRRFLDSCGDEPNGYWVFMDRPDAGKDNGEALYRHCMTNQIHDRLAFILREDSIDYPRLQKEGFHLIPYNSMEHWKTLKNAEFFFTSHCDGFLRYPWYYTGPRSMQKKVKKEHPVNHLYRIVFLQHGVIRSDLSDWLGAMPYYRFVSSAYPERHSLLQIPRYNLGEEMVVFSGLPRWDRLENKAEKIITVFPTWRKDLYFGERDDLRRVFEESTFGKEWLAFWRGLADSNCLDDYTLQLVLHHDNDLFVSIIRELVPDRIKLIPYDEVESFSEVVNRSAMLITDYSSFSFDFLYLNKPVVYYDFEKNAQENNVKGMEYDRFGYYCPDTEDAVRTVEELAGTGFALAKEKQEAIDGLFTDRSRSHCQRVIDSL